MNGVSPSVKFSQAIGTRDPKQHAARAELHAGGCAGGMAGLSGDAPRISPPSLRPSWHGLLEAGIAGLVRMAADLFGGPCFTTHLFIDDGGVLPQSRWFKSKIRELD